jgi:hypothetical protein
MKYLTTIIKKIFPKELPKPVGRWRIENCNKQMNSKIDLSNEDHCGPCGEYALTKIEFEKSQSNIHKNSKTKYISLDKSEKF